MADWTGCVLFSLTVLTCFSVSIAGDNCSVGGSTEPTYCPKGCCHDYRDYDREFCCPNEDGFKLGMAIGGSVLGLLLLLGLVLRCRQAYYRWKLDSQRVIAGRLDITVVRHVQHPGYGYDQPAFPEQSQDSSLGRQSGTGTPSNQGGPPTPTPTGQPSPRIPLSDLLRILHTAPLPPRSTATPPTSGRRLHRASVPVTVESAK